jgi:ABC-2 family transporter protein
MNPLPVAERELRLLARRSRTYHVRAGTALVVIVASVAMLYAGFAGQISAPSAGRALFLLLSCAAAICVMLDGTLLTADCLSSEKREGTLGLLFLTDLKGYDVVAGKLISQTANSAYALLAALPALAIALFLGGVTGFDVIRMTLALLNALFYAAALGMLVSACCRRERLALSLAFFCVVMLAGLLPLLGWGLSVWRQTGSIHPLFLLGSPAGAFLRAVQLGMPGQGFAFSFAGALFWSQLLAWGFLVVAGLILPGTVREEAVARRSGRLAGKPRRDRHAGMGGAWWPGRPAEPNPLIRAGDRPGQRGLGMWPLFLVLAASWAAGWALVRSQWLTLPVYALTVVLLHACLSYFVVLNACRGPRDDLRSGVLEILLTTPLGDDAYLTGRMLSLKRQCLWPLLAVLAVDLGLMVAGCWETGPMNWEWLGWVTVFAVLTGRLLVDLYTLSWVGFWQGLKTGDTGQAMRKTFLHVFILRWLVLIGLMALVGALTLGRVFQSPVGVILAGLVYVTFPLASLQSLCQAMSESQDNLRALALGQGLPGDSAGWFRATWANRFGRPSTTADCADTSDGRQPISTEDCGGAPSRL